MTNWIQKGRAIWSITVAKRLIGAAGIMAIVPVVCLVLIRPAYGVGKPNVVLVITDDQGFGDLGAHGHPKLKTPHLDELHQDSVRLSNFHVDPTCSPTRAALMTGRYSTRTGVWHTVAGRSLMAPGERTMAEVFNDAGYRTGHFGKWHLGDNYPLRPQDQGFDHVLRNGGGGVTQAPDYWGNDYFDDTYYQNGRPVTFRGYCTDIWFDNAIEFIERNRNRPFFAYITTNAAHSPFRVPDQYEKMYEQMGVGGTRAGFYGMITNIDDNMGRLREKLDKLDLSRETILIFTTDNGSAKGAYSAGLRANKGSEYDGGHRVPFMIRYPAGGLTGGRQIKKVTAHIDVLPTLAELCGLARPSSPRGPIDGKSLVPLLKGDADNWPDRTLFVHSQRVQSPRKWRKAAVMTDRWRLVNKNKLYDMRSDRDQNNNVADQHPQVVDRLQNAYDQWWDSLKPRFDEFVRITIGSKHENPARITGHDWHPVHGGVPWSQGAVKNMKMANGWWAIRVAQAGRYRFTLRHQPMSAAKEIQADKAKLKVGNVERTRPVKEGATAVTFEVELEKGPTRLQTWFDPQAEKSRGAYYIRVKRQQ